MQADLRLATQEVHERLHEAEPFSLIAQGALAMPAYRSLLGAILRFHSAVQPILAGGPQTAALCGGRERMERLQSDLNDIGAGGQSPPPATLALEPDRILGCLYVVQGSTLGGKVIYRQLDYLFDGTRGRSFFLGGAEDKARWQKVCALLENEPPERREGLRRGAAETFAFFEQCLAGERLQQ